MSISKNIDGRAVVLFIDGNADVRRMAREHIERAGFEFREADSHESGIAAFAADAPDIVLLDTMMPEMDGLRVCTTIRGQPGGQHLPVIVFTGAEDVEAVNRAYDAGATDFTGKPINHELLVRRIRYALRAGRTANQLRAREACLAHAQKIANLGSWELDLVDHAFDYSDQLCAILGRPAGETRLTYMEMMEAIHPTDRPEVEEGLRRVREKGGRCTVDHRIVRPTGGETPVRQEAEVVTDEAGKALKLIATVQPTAERRASGSPTREPAFYDSVTGLPNRALVTEHLRNAVANARRHDRIVAVLFIDLDRFRRVNDTWGHRVGDELLRNVAVRLTECLRAGDSVARRVSGGLADASEQADEPTLARLEGDEFVVVLREIRRIEDAAVVARRVIDGLAAPFVVKGTEVYITASIGISGFPTDGSDEEILLQRASAAMCQAKEEGRNAYHFCTEDNNARAMRRLNVEAHLRRALENGDFLLHYQPKVDAATGRVCGMEALVRWHDPLVGLISPAEFIPVAEETRLIVPLGEWVLRTACAQTRKWHDMGLGPLPVSVNISAAQFRRGEFVNTVSRVLAWTELDPCYLELELTESLLIEDADANIDLLHGLRRLGLKLSIDDFGTGYSSLSYLKRFPIDVLKIDRAFIRDIGTDPDDAAIVRATVGLAHSLRLGVVAEGVEEQAQYEFLRDCGCDQIQGFYFSRPLPSDEFAEWVLARGGREPREAAGGQ